MKGSKARHSFNSFDGLKALLETDCLPNLSMKSKNAPRSNPDACGPKTEAQMFHEAMADVLPLSKRPRADCLTRARGPEPLPPKSVPDGIPHLEALVKNGTGFKVSQTPEYIEGTGYRVHRRMASRLHTGEFSIQDELDLHGFDVPSARKAFDRFLNRALKTGRRGLLIVHGRGLSSPREPVLKHQVCQWLSGGCWKKWVIAFSSARSCDGGAGATYVLLRKQAMTKGRLKRLERTGFAKGHLS